MKRHGHGPSIAACLAVTGLLLAPVGAVPGSHVEAGLPAGTLNLAQLDGEGREAPDGMPSLEQFERERKAREQPGSTMIGSGVEPGEAGAPQASEKPGEEAEIKRLARRILAVERTIKEKVEALDALEMRAFASRQAVTDAGSVSNAVSSIKTLEEYLESAKALRTEISTTLEKAEEIAVAAEAIKVEMAAEREARKREEIRRQKEAEHKALVEEETDRAKTAAGDNGQHIEEFKFQEALAGVKALQAGFRTEEAKAVLNNLIERYDLLVRLKAAMIEQINEAPLRYGWQLRRQREHILGADESGVKLKGRTVAWPDVYDAQLQKLFKHYLNKGSLPFGERSRMHLAVAILYDEKEASEVSRLYAERAVQMSSYLDKDVRRLLPPE